MEDVIFGWEEVVLGNQNIELDMGGGESREKGGYRFKDACAGTDDIRASEFFASNIEHALEMPPIGDICMLKYGLGTRL